MKRLILLLPAIMFSLYSFCQTKETIILWPGKVPGEVNEKKPPVIAESRNDNVTRYDEVTNPLLEVFRCDLPNKRNAAVIVCPGGGYRILAYDKEGTEIAKWLNSLGYTAFVLQYRIPDKRDGALQDAQRAIRLVRSKAAMYGVDPDRIGIMGFSAGGSLSARAATRFGINHYPPVDAADSLSCRPSFALLIYPAYLDQGVNRTLTPEITLTDQTPPMFIFETIDDPYGNSAIVMAGAMRDARLRPEVHLLPEGGHGYGLRPGKRAAEKWPVLAAEWLFKTLPDKQ